MAHFTDWFPTLLAMAGLETPADRHLDGVNALPILRGEHGRINPQRFWQWNRYTPLSSCNAAMRDGDWKLVRPQIAAAMAVSPLDTALDHAIKYVPERFSDIIRDPEPQRELPPPPPALLFNIADDPGERDDLAQEHPARVAAMEAALERWFVDATRI